MATASASSPSKSGSFLSRWLKNSWISRLGLFWRRELTETSKKKNSPQLQVESLEQKAVCMDALGAVKAGAMGMGLAALAGSLPTPMDVVMEGWSAGQNNPPPSQQPGKGKPLSEKQCDSFFTHAPWTDPRTITIAPPPPKPQEEGGSAPGELPQEETEAQPQKPLQFVSVLEENPEEDRWLAEVDQALNGELPSASDGKVAGPTSLGGGGGGGSGGGGTESSPPQFNTGTGPTTTPKLSIPTGAPGTGGGTDPFRQGAPGGSPNSGGGGQVAGFQEGNEGDNNANGGAGNGGGGGIGGALQGGVGGGAESQSSSQSSSLLSGGEGGSSQSQQQTPNFSPALEQGYSSQPLAFELNQGQVSETVQYLARGHGYSIYLTSQEMVLTLSHRREPTDREIRERPELDGERVLVRDVVRIQLVDGNSTASLVGQQQLTSRSNYFIDSATNLALTDIPNYGQVLARNVYDGIDVRYQEEGGQLRFDLEVAAGADPDQITLEYQGTASQSVDRDGRLHLKLASGETVVQQAPVIYQDVEGERQQRTGRYLQRENGQIGFAVDSYDDSRALIIDPTLSYSAFVGGTGNDVATAVAVDGSGSVYLAGYTGSADFPTENPYQSSLPGSSSYFITRLSPDGSEVIYSTYLDNYVPNPGSNAISLAVDLGGYAYLAGTTSNSSFPLQNAYQDTLQGSSDAFVTKLSPAGNALVYSTYLGGTDGDGATGIAVDGAGRAYVTGHTSSTDFDLKGAWQTSFGGNTDAFVTRLDSDGQDLGYSSWLGGSDIEEAYDVAVDVQGRAYVTGWTQSSDFTTTTAAYDTTLGGIGDAFVTRINSAGDAVEYSTFLGGDSEQGMGEEGHGIDVDSQGRAYVTGFVDGASDFPTSPEAYDTTLNSTDAAFVTRLNSDGTGLSYSTFLEGSDGSAKAYDVVVNSDDEAWVIGGTSSTDFPTESPLQSARTGNDDAFITRLNSSGTGLGYSSYWGYSANDEAYAVALDWEGDPVVAGYSQPDQELPGMLIRNSTVAEGDSGSTSSSFTVELSEEARTTVTVEWSTSGDTATSNTDFTAASGTLTFAPGETSRTISVSVLGDTELEDDEFYSVNLSGVSGATLLNSTATGAIVEDEDADPAIYVHDSWITEGDSGTVQAVFDVWLTKASDSTVSVGWETNDDTATTSDSDYTSASGTLTWSAGEMRKTISVSVNGDTDTDEYDEYFTVDLSSPSGATIDDGTGTGTIVDDDDATPDILIFGGPAWITEGDSGTDQIEFPVRLSQSSGSSITVQWATSDNSATTSDDDYESASGTLTFSSGQVEKFISVDVNGDTRDEYEENFDVDLSNASGAVIESNSTTLYGYLNDDDDYRWPRLMVSDSMILEPDSGTDQALLTVTLDRVSSETLVVTWSTSDGSATNSSNDDYDSDSGTLTFDPGQTSKTISVDVNADTVREGSEYFTVHLSTSEDLNLLDSAPEVYVVEPLSNTIEHGPGGNSDAFVLRFEGAGSRPAAPVITSISSDTGSSSEDRITSDQTVILYGTATAGATVNVYRANVGLLGTAVADSQGDWSYDYTATTLPDGIHSFEVTQTISGTTSLRSNLEQVTVGTTAPEVTLEMESSTSDFSPEVKVVAPDGLFPGNEAVVAVDLDLDNDGNFTDPGETGYYTFAIDDGIGYGVIPDLGATGTYRVRARVSDPAGNEGTSAVSIFTVSSVTDWTISDATRTVDPLQGDFLSQAGIWQTFHQLDLDDSPGVEQSGDSVLVYNSDRVAVQPIVAAQLQSPNNTDLPDTLTAKLYWNGSGTADATTEFDTSGYDKGETFIIAMQNSSSVGTTGRYTYKLEVTDGTSTWSITDVVFVVAEDSSDVGAGWTFGNVDRLKSVSSQTWGTYTFDAGMLRIYGTGGHSFYEQDGASYDSPAGDNGTLATYTVGTATYYRYTTPDGFQQDFEHANGTSTYYLSKEISSDGHEAITYTFDGSHHLTGIETADSELTTLTYSSGKISTIQTGTRTVTLTVSGGDLVTIENPDGGLRTLTYDASSRLIKDELAGIVGSVAYSDGVVTDYTMGDHAASEDEGVSIALSPSILKGLETLHAGVVQSVATDPQLHSTRQELDLEGRPTRLSLADGGETVWTRNGEGWITAVEDALENVTSYTLDGDGYVTGIENPDGSLVTYTYSGTPKRMQSFTDEEGHTWTSTWYGDGLQESVKDPLGFLTSYVYYTAGASDGLLKTVEDALNNVTSFTWDSQRRLSTTENALGFLTTSTYDGNGNLATFTDEEGNTTSYVNDAVGRVIQMTDAEGGIWTSTFDGAGRRTQTIDAEGRITQFEHNSRGDRKRTIQAVGTGVQRSFVQLYNEVAEPYLSRTAGGAWTQMGFDPVGRVQTVTDPLNFTRKTLRNQAGQAVQPGDELGRIDTNVYNSRGWITKSTDPLGNVTSWTYDKTGRVKTVINAENQTTEYDYDALGQMTEMTQAEGTIDERSFTFSYDGVGNLISETDGEGKETAYELDDLYRVTTLIAAKGDPLAQTYTYVHDKVGNETSRTEPDGVRTDTTYDKVYRVTSITQAAGTSNARTHDWVYNDVGEVTSFEDYLNRTTLITRNDLGDEVLRVEASGTGVEAATTTFRNSDGRVQGTLDFLGKFISYGYSLKGELVLVMNALEGVERYFYDGVGNLTGILDNLLNLTQLCRAELWSHSSPN